MVYTVTLNPALDYDVYLDNFQSEQLNLSKAVYFRAGGKGINVSKVLKALGVNSVVTGFTGGFTGAYIKNDLESQGIENDFIEVAGTTRINVKINNSNKETEIAGLSPTITDRHMALLLSKLQHMQKGDFLILSGSIPESISKTVYKEIAKVVGKDVKIVMDTRGNLIQQNMSHYFLLKPNIGELEVLFDKPFNTDKEIVEGCSYFLENGIQNIIVSKGKEGAIFVSKEICLTAKAPEGNLVNSVGAGDSMVAGFVAGVIEGKTIEESFKQSVACGSATAFSLGLATKKVVEELYRKITIETM